MPRILSALLMLAALFFAGSLAGPVRTNALVVVNASSGCWVHAAAGYRPRVSLDVTPTQKLEALAISVQFGEASQAFSSVLSVQYDAEQNVHYQSVLTGHSAVGALPSTPVTALVNARILPYAARNTTALGQVKAEKLVGLRLPHAVCKG